MCLVGAFANSYEQEEGGGGADHGGSRQNTKPTHRIECREPPLADLLGVLACSREFDDLLAVAAAALPGARDSAQPLCPSAALGVERDGVLPEPGCRHLRVPLPPLTADDLGTAAVALQVMGQRCDRGVAGMGLRHRRDNPRPPRPRVGDLVAGLVLGERDQRVACREADHGRVDVVCQHPQHQLDRTRLSRQPAVDAVCGHDVGDGDVAMLAHGLRWVRLHGFQDRSHAIQAADLHAHPGSDFH
jgi:hypothetical protein